MSFEKLYLEKVFSKSYSLKLKEVEARLDKHDLSKYSKDEKYLFILLDDETNDSIVLRASKLLSSYKIEKKTLLFTELCEFVDEINIEAFLNCLSGEDYTLLYDIFVLFLSSEKVSCADKFYLYLDLSENSMPAACLCEYTDLVLDVGKVVLSSSGSSKGEVRMAVSTIKKIANNIDDYGYVLGFVEELYKNNILWEKLYEEEIAYRHKILSSSFDMKVSVAFKNKDYRKVVRLIGDYEEELPSTLRKKLDISRRKLNKPS